MGLFSKILKENGSSSSFSNEEAFVGLIISITSLDGNISSDEMN